jgi:hypothetical protein
MFFYIINLVTHLSISFVLFSLQFVVAVQNGIIGKKKFGLYITLQVAMLRAFLKCDFSFLNLEL